MKNTPLIHRDYTFGTSIRITPKLNYNFDFQHNMRKPDVFKFIEKGDIIRSLHIVFIVLTTNTKVSISKATDTVLFAD